ncbi:hypothetical protein F3157_10785 [Virgibacillus dakarensis]|uniref:Uncharacterized protein n=1 Tax=Lentibacillus populi TaxID=1827502 RepID=A0A9W5X688_9BACI|nr:MULTISPECIES: hypothetical protein [Bacillaceae]MTW86142.1 hypothetical protein [Virgibacillus dakarensis]GGB46459.1 hypothetical protein GCM10011409_25020 [Lentibacillus populi]
MLVTPSISDLLSAQQAIESFKRTKPMLYRRFMNVIHLTRQLQYGYQYMGCLIMNEDPSRFRPMSQDDYVLAVYQQEIEKLKEDRNAQDLKQLLDSYRQIGYPAICKLILGTNPKILVGPVVIR